MAQYDIVITGGCVIDPETGLDAVRNVGIKGDKIAAVTEKAIEGKETIDATGHVVCPGFIDMHNHNAGYPFGQKLALRDGVTTPMELELGVYPVKEWYEGLDGKSRTNYGGSVSSVAVREFILNPDLTEMFHGYFVLDMVSPAKAHTSMKWSQQPSTADQIEQFEKMMEEGLQQGSVGVGHAVGYMVDGCSAGIRDLPEAGRQVRPVDLCALPFLQPDAAHERPVGLLRDDGTAGDLRWRCGSPAYVCPGLAGYEGRARALRRGPREGNSGDRRDLPVRLRRQRHLGTLPVPGKLWPQHGADLQGHHPDLEPGAPDEGKLRASQGNGPLYTDHVLQRPGRGCRQGAGASLLCRRQRWLCLDRSRDGRDRPRLGPSLRYSQRPPARRRYPRTNPRLDAGEEARNPAIAGRFEDDLHDCKVHGGQRRSADGGQGAHPGGQGRGHHDLRSRDRPGQCHDEGWRASVDRYPACVG